jgi:UDP-N-acetylmuramoyl-tripeptide--D-alanyl-D-alanine ligase
VTLQLPGDHNVTNALAAACAGLACGLAPAEIAAGLAAVSAVPGRLAQCRTAAGATLIDDCYNANPGSMRAALELLAACEGRRIAALGAMKELGADSASLHRELGGFARQIGIDELLGVGEELVDTVAGFGDGARHFDSMEALLAWLQRDLGEGDTLLVKGSRSAGMERVVEALSAAGEEGGTCS